jgi:regulator of protease activity HflC (stomatin/prohibitin superfamily)
MGCVSVTSVEIRDVAIPVALQDAMSRQAQAEREKQARVILGSAEAEIAGKFVSRLPRSMRIIPPPCNCAQ